MVWISTGVALLLALAIIAVGARYIANPIAATPSFGLPLPDAGANTLWWLRLKGVRDIVSGLAVLAFMGGGTPRTVGIILLVEAVIPVGDMLLVLAAKGSTRSAVGIHGATALLMILASIPLVTKAA